MATATQNGDVAAATTPSVHPNAGALAAAATALRHVDLALMAGAPSDAAAPFARTAMARLAPAAPNSPERAPAHLTASWSGPPDLRHSHSGAFRIAHALAFKLRCMDKAGRMAYQ